MATIYKFVIERQNASDGGGRKGGDATTTRASKGASKKGKLVSLFGGEKGGVEHNRKMRVVNPLINKATGGAWEKGTRVARAGVGMAKNVKEKGIGGIFAGPALAIIIQLVLIGLLKFQQFERDKAQKQNEQNFKQLENGIGQVNGAYRITTDIITGRQTYNQNK